MKAFVALESIGHVKTYAGWNDAYRPLIERWWTMRQQGHGHPLVERTNANRYVLNTLAQAVRVKAGEVGRPIRIGAKRFGIGDEVIARQPARTLVSAAGEHVRNGSTGTITAITQGAMVVDFNDLGAIRIPHAWVAQPRGLELAYAMTSFAIQGATNDASTSVITRGASAAELLVNLTRGRHQNVVFAIADGDNNDEFAAERSGDATHRIVASIRTRRGTSVTRADQTHTVAEFDIGI